MFPLLHIYRPRYFVRDRILNQNDPICLTVCKLLLYIFPFPTEYSLFADATNVYLQHEMYYHEEFKYTCSEPHSKKRDLITGKEPTKNKWQKNSEKWRPTAYSYLSVKSIVVIIIVIIINISLCSELFTTFFQSLTQFSLQPYNSLLEKIQTIVWRVVKQEELLLF